MGVKYTSIFKAYTEVALNASPIKWVLRACTWASYITSAFQFSFSPIKLCQIDTSYVIWGIIPALNTLQRGRKLPPYVDLVMLDRALMLLFAFSLIIDIWSFQLSFD